MTADSFGSRAMLRASGESLMLTLASEGVTFTTIVPMSALISRMASSAAFLSSGESCGPKSWSMRSSESRSTESHRAVAKRPTDEQCLEERIRAVATYDPNAWDLWEEVRR